ncbi:PE/PPE C-terminal domain-containing protein [Pseudomonas sp. PDM15]|nr:PE/PPE C-terminal domain-containing protein [Pseudomonas sp. PDM15]
MHDENFRTSCLCSAGLGRATSIGQLSVPGWSRAG